MILSFETFIKVINHFKFDVWVIVGFLGQLFFSMRFIIQWIKSEKEKQSIVPYSFWIFSGRLEQYFLSKRVQKSYKRALRPRNSIWMG